MAGKEPRRGSSKKEPQRTLKERREAKRDEAQERTAFIKPRKTAR